MRKSGPVVTVVAVICAIIAFIGWAFLGWEF